MVVLEHKAVDTDYYVVVLEHDTAVLDYAVAVLEHDVAVHEHYVAAAPCPALPLSMLQSSIYIQQMYV